MDKNMKKPLVTILMPVYNGGKYLREAIDSILCQTFNDFVFLIIDDGSTDNSANIIKSYEDKRIVFLVNEKNIGISKTLNLGIDNSDTKYIARMDQDDISLPNRIAEQVNFMELKPDIGVCGTWMLAFNSKNQSALKKRPIKNDAIKTAFLFYNPIAHPTAMIRKNILDKNNLQYDPLYDGLEDYDLWERISFVAKMENIPKALLFYRLHETQLSRISPARQEKLDKIQGRQYERLGIKKVGSLRVLLSANKKYKLYDNWSLRKFVYGLYYIKIKAFIKNKIKRFFRKINVGIGVFLIVLKNWLFLRFKKNIKLHLGSGGIKIKDFINVDSLFLKNTELVSSVKNLKYFIKSRSVSNIYASHLFEHFSEKEVKKILKELHKLLQKDGEMRISVPDIDKIVKIYSKNWEHFQKKGHSPWNGLIYGGQSTKYDFHKTGFNAQWLRFLLQEAGFKQVEEYNSREFCKKHEIDDCSTKDTPFGEIISLNMIAIKQ